MSSRVAQETTARRLRMAADAEQARRAGQRLYRRRLGGALLGAVAVVEVAVAACTSQIAHVTAIRGGRVPGAAFSSRR